MKNFKRVLCITLCLLIILSMTAIMGCKKGDKDTEAGTTSVTTKEYNVYDDDLPEMNYDGEEISVLCRQSDGVTDEISVDKENLDNSIVELVYNRNLAVEARMNVKINPILTVDESGAQYWETLARKISTSVMAGDNAYDITWMPFNSFHAIQGLYRDLNAIDSIDLNKYYWSQNFNACYQVAGSQYSASGMAALSFYRYMYLYTYNEDMFADYKIDPLFETVKSGEWTMDKLYTLTKDIYEDDGNNQRGKEDTFGFVSGGRTSIDPYWVTLDLTFVEKDVDDLYTLNIDVERITKGIDMVINQYYLNPGSYIVPTGNDNFDNKDILEIFVDERAAIAQLRVKSIEDVVVKEAEFEYSVVPMPKYDADQTSYYTHESDQMTAFGIVNNPGTDDDRLYMLGAFLEAMGSESYKTLYLQYFENILSYRFMQNPESVEMLNIIYESVNIMSTFQGTELPSGALINGLRGQIASGFNNFASYLKSKESAMNKDFEALNEFYGNS